MKPVVAAAFSLILLAGCLEEDKPAASTETSPGGIEYARLFIPGAKDVAIQLAWPSTWATRDSVNQAVPFIGMDLILAGGAQGFPAGEVVETFADLKAEGSLWVTPDYLHGELIVARENLAKAAEIAHAHLAAPTLDQSWFDRIQQGFAANVAEAQAVPANRGLDALGWATLGDTPLRRALSFDPPDMITSATRDDVADWHRQAISRAGVRVVIAGEIDSATAGTAVDALLQGLPEGQVVTPVKPVADFTPRRILLHDPDAATSTLFLVGPLPPTREGGESDDILIAVTLGGDDQSVLFDAVRTGLRATYGFGAALGGFSRDLRLLVLSGEVETTKLAEAETVVRTTYAGFRASGDVGDVEARKDALISGSEPTAEDPVVASYSAMMGLLDDNDPGLALQLPSLFRKITAETVKARLATAFPAADALITLAVSPDATALPGACVIRLPEEAAACP